MRTPDVLLSGARPLFHFCRECGKKFEHRSGGNVFHSKECRWRFGRDARKALFLLDRSPEHDLAPRAVIGFVTQKPSPGHSGEINAIREVLDFFDNSISLYGPDASCNVDIKQRADDIRAYLETVTNPNADELRAYVHALEILRDTCSESTAELTLRRWQSWAAVCYYRQIRESVGLGRALLSFGNICKMLGDKERAREIWRWAYDVLADPRQPQSPNRLLVMHQALVLDLRSCTDGYGDRRANQQHDATVALERRINTPLIKLQTQQELAGYYRMRGWLDDSEDAINKVDGLLATVNISSFYKATSLRAKVEFYIQRDRERAVDLIEREYLPAYRTSPRKYQREHLQRWHDDLGLDSPNDLPESYDSPILFYAPRGEL